MFKKFLYIVFLIGFITNAQTNPNISPWDYCQDGNPIGGGTGYDNIITSGDITITTSDNWSTFKNKVEGATSGQVVFINSNVSMDLTSLNSNAILVPAGVTIASDRGNAGSNGALLYSNQVKYNNSGYERPVFVTAGTNVRFTGFNLRGPYGFSGTYSATDSDLRLKYGISSNYDNTEVDNMHGYNWPSGFVTFSRYSSNSTFFGPLQETTGHRVHHNYIHNNLQNLRGYGVDSQNAYTVIYANMFHSHRHDINTKGTANSGYEGYCNTVISEFPANTGFTLNGPVGAKVYSITSDGSGNTISYNPKQSGNTHNNFENHAAIWCQDRYNYAECSPPTSTSYIHHNDFKDDKVARHGQTSDAQNISINGIPQSGNTRVEYNRTVRTALLYPDAPDYDYMIRQLFVPANDQGTGLTLVGNVLDGGTPGGQTGGTSGEITDIRFVSTQLPQFWVDENTVDPSSTLEVVTTESGETYTFETVARASYDDSGFFTITGSSIVMDNGSTFTPDYENPLDATNANNIYGFDIKATSSSGKTYTRDMAFYINDVTDEGGEVFVSSLVFDNDTQTIFVGETVDKSHTFNGNASIPTNTGVTYYSGSTGDEFILTHDGVGTYKGTEYYYILANDTENGTILDEMTVTINPDAWKQSRVSSGAIKTSGSSGKIYIGK